ELRPVFSDRSWCSSFFRDWGSTGCRSLYRACPVEVRLARILRTVACCQTVFLPVGVGVLAAFRRLVICRQLSCSSTKARYIVRTTSASEGSIITWGAQPYRFGRYRYP